MPSTRIEIRDVHTRDQLSLIDDGAIQWSSERRWGEEFFAEHHCIEALDSPEFCMSTHSVVLHPGPRVRLEQKIRGEFRSYTLGEGDVEIFPACAPKQIRHGRKTILIFALAPALVARVAGEVHGGRASEIEDHPRLRDAGIAQIAMLLAEEARIGFAHGQIYGESLGTALAAYLVQRYSGAETCRERIRGLAPLPLRRVVEYIDANLSEELSLPSLAEVAGLSTHRFAHNFKRATGLAPYRYVIRERLERAKRMLRETDQTITAIAYATGFGSPGRFALLFRRATGTTPSAFRACFR